MTRLVLPEVRWLRLGAVFAALAVLAACNGSETSSTNEAQSALSADDKGEIADQAARAACLTTFVGCVREGTEEESCHDALRACAPPPPNGKGLGQGPGCEGAPPPPPNGAPPQDADNAGPPPEPPPPPQGADGDPSGPPEGGPHACIDALVACAKSDEAVESCVSAATTCFESDRHPPPFGPPGAPNPSEPAQE